MTFTQIGRKKQNPRSDTWVQHIYIQKVCLILSKMGCLGIWRHPKLHLEASKRMHIKRGCTAPLSHARCGQAHILSPVTSATGGGWKNFLALRVSSRCPEYLHLESGCEEPRGQAPSSRQHPGLPGALPVPRLAGPHEGPSRCHLHLWALWALWEILGEMLWEARGARFCVCKLVCFTCRLVRTERHHLSASTQNQLRGQLSG